MVIRLSVAPLVSNGRKKYTEIKQSVTIADTYPTWVSVTIYRKVARRSTSWLVSLPNSLKIEVDLL